MCFYFMLYYLGNERSAFITGLRSRCIHRVQPSVHEYACIRQKKRGGTT